MTKPDLQAIIAIPAGSTHQSYISEKICGRELMVYPLAMLEKLAIPTSLMIDQSQLSAAMHEYVQQQAIPITQHIPTITANHLLVIPSTMPFVSAENIQQLCHKHYATNAAISIMIAHNPLAGNQYARVSKRDKKITITKQNAINRSPWICAGLYIISKELLSRVSSLNLIHLIEKAQEYNLQVTVHKVDFDSIRMISSHQELWEAEQIERSRLIKQWMNNGIRFTAPQTVQLDYDVIIGRGTTIGNGVHVLRGTSIGDHCTINAYSLLEQAKIADHTTIDAHSVIRNATIGTHSRVGPFAHIHTHSVIGSHTIIGNFVEIKESIIGNNTKAKHLNYLGNAHIGNEVNIGAGTITCNHNGINREQTTIHDHAYIGSNNSLVAPITIEANAFTAAGSVITNNVPENAFAIARARQVNKEGYALKLRNKYSKALFKGAQKVSNPDSAC